MSEILNMLNEATRPDTRSQADREAAAAERPYWEKVEAAFSLPFVDGMYSAVCESCDVACREHFTRGFHLGAQLMLEVFTPRPV